VSSISLPARQSLLSCSPVSSPHHRLCSFCNSLLVSACLFSPFLAHNAPRYRWSSRTFSAVYISYDEDDKTRETLSQSQSLFVLPSFLLKLFFVRTLSICSQRSSYHSNSPRTNNSSAHTLTHSQRTVPPLHCHFRLIENFLVATRPHKIWLRSNFRSPIAGRIRESHHE
jgi:hypothetical protein